MKITDDLIIEAEDLKRLVYTLVLSYRFHNHNRDPDKVVIPMIKEVELDQPGTSEKLVIPLHFEFLQPVQEIGVAPVEAVAEVSDTLLIAAQRRNAAGQELQGMIDAMRPGVPAGEGEASDTALSAPDDGSGEDSPAKPTKPKPRKRKPKGGKGKH